MQPEKLPADYYERVRDAKRHILDADLRDAFDEYRRIEFVNFAVTDEQRAEFLAHVAHTIGYDLTGTYSLVHAYDAYLRQHNQRARDGN